MNHFAFLAAALLATTTLAQARDIDAQIAGFIGAAGFAPADVTALETGLGNLWRDDGGMSPGSTVGPIEKAMLIADTAIPSTRTRTAIAYGEIIEEEDGIALPYSFIEVRHYNLSQVIRAEAVAAYGAENTDEPAAFGLGEHMAWRFVFRPAAGNAAVLIDASSRVIPDAKAKGQDCDSRPCLDPHASLDDRAEWQEIHGKLPTWPPLYPTRSGEISAPAYAISRLAVFGYWANAEAGYYQWTGGEHPEAARGYAPYRFIAIDRDLGQEPAIDTVWRETQLNDDALSAIAFRRQDIAGEVRLMRASESRQPPPTP